MKTQKVFDIDVAWAAVSAADRINEGKYINGNSLDAVPAKFNKSIAHDMCENPHQLLAEDRLLGEKLQDHFQGLLFKRLTGKLTNGFLNTIADIVTKKQVTLFDLACMSSLVKTYRQDIERENKIAREQALFSTSDYLGLEGSKHQLTVEVTNTIYSRNYDIHIITATDGENLIKFSTGNSSVVFYQGEKTLIKGTVKRCEVDDRTGVKVTWLNRVKKI
jgi:hypothetical protein